MSCVSGRHDAEYRQAFPPEPGLGAGLAAPGSARIDADPLTHSVLPLAQTLFRKLESEAFELEQLSALAEEVHLTLLDERAGQFRRQYAGADTAAAWAPVTARLKAPAAESFDAYRAAAETPGGGIVFTAYPTFALSQDLRAAMAAYATKPAAGHKASRAARAACRLVNPRLGAMCVFSRGQASHIPGMPHRGSSAALPPTSRLSLTLTFA